MRGLREWRTHFDVERSDVFDLAHFGDLLLDLVCERDGREDGEGAILEADNGAAPTNLDATEACKGNGEGGDSARDDFADDHHLGGI